MCETHVAHSELSRVSLRGGGLHEARRGRGRRARAVTRGAWKKLEEVWKKFQTSPTLWAWIKRAIPSLDSRVPAASRARVAAVEVRIGVLGPGL